MMIRCPRVALAAGAAVGAVVLASGAWLAFGHRDLSPPGVEQPLTWWERGPEEYPRRHQGPPLDPRTLLFRESAAEAGLAWQMRSLPGEQGETFKVNLYDHGCGLAVADFNGDGHDDIYFCNQLGPNALYRNNGNGTFVDVAAEAGVALGDRVCVGATFFDYDNDGKPDLYVTSTRGGNVLFRNLGGGRFLDVTASAGLTHVGHSQTAVCFDYDNDGRLDLFLANTADWTFRAYDRATHSFVGKGLDDMLIFSPREHNVLYRNNGDGTFTDVTDRAGLRGRGWAGDAVAFDYDGDGRVDLFVTSMFGRCQLYRNNGDGTFTDVTLGVLGRTPFGALGARLLDFNNDGRLDLYVVDMHSDMWMDVDWDHTSLPTALEVEQIKFPHPNGPHKITDPFVLQKQKEQERFLGYRQEEVLYGNAFYRNDGGGQFTEISDRAGLETFWPWGIATGDFTNGGREDIFLTAGMGYPFYYWPNYLLRNQGDGTFRDQASASGIEPLPRGLYLPERVGGRPAARSSRCAAVADFDGDGRLEVVVNNFNDRPSYFRNQGAGKNYVGFRLRGTRSNRDAVGAVVRLYHKGRVLTRQVQGAGGYLAQSSRTLHFGLGDDTAIDRVEIAWPSGRRQTLAAVTPNTVHDVTEPEPAGGHH
jgi:hypothetical protein